MTIRCLAIIALLGTAPACFPPLEYAHYDPEKASSIRAGMTKDDVTALMGRPNHMFLQAPNGRVVEVWAYADGYDSGTSRDAAYFRIGFDDRGVVVVTQTLPRPPSRY